MGGGDAAGSVAAAMHVCSWRKAPVSKDGRSEARREGGAVAAAMHVCSWRKAPVSKDGRSEARREGGTERRKARCDHRRQKESLAEDVWPRCGDTSSIICGSVAGL